MSFNDYNVLKFPWGFRDLGTLGIKTNPDRGYKIQKRVMLRVFGYTALWLNTSAIFVLVSTHSRIEGAVHVIFNLHYNTYHHHSWVCI